jgi:hypothetical protein
VVAVARAMQGDLQAELEEVRRSIRSMHRTLAWEGEAPAAQGSQPQP